MVDLCTSDRQKADALPRRCEDRTEVDEAGRHRMKILSYRDCSNFVASRC